MNNVPHINQQRGVIAWFAQNPVAANLLMIFILALGLMQMGNLRKESFPSVEPSKITVAISYDSGSAQQAEEGLAIKIEDSLESISGIKNITSTSTSSGTRVQIEKTSAADLQTLLNDVTAEVDAISSFPSGADNPVISKATRQDHALQIAIYGDTDRKTLQDLQEELKQDLLRQSAISEVVTLGERDPKISIELDEAKLQAYGLTFSDISTVINAESANSVGGEIRGENRTFSIDASAQAYRYQDFANIVLKTSANGGQLLLSDVAIVRDTYEDNSSAATRFQGQPAMSIQMVMNDDSDITDVVTQANNVVEKWQSNGKLPENVRITAWYDKSDFIQDRLTLMTSNALQGMLMVGILLALFLNIRVAFWVTAGLPFCFIGTFFFMGDSWMGLTINEMTTFGFIMAIGIVVDDAVVVGESIYDTKQKHGDSLENTIKGTKRVAIPTMFGVLTTVAAFYPITQIDGHLGKIFAQFATIVVICILLSLIESKLILPAHLAHMSTKKKKPANIFSKALQASQNSADKGLKHFTQKMYLPLLKIALKYRYAVMLGFVSLLILSAGLITTGQVRSVFFPEIEGEVITANFSTVDDAGYGLAEAHMATLEDTLALADQEVQQAFHYQGSLIKYVQTTISDDNTGTLTVEMKGDSPASINDLKSVWERITPKLEAVNSLQFSSRWRGSDDLRIELLGNDIEQLTLAGAELRSILEDTPGVSSLEDNMSAGQPKIRLSLNAQGRALGFSSADLATQARQNFGGSKVQSYQRNFDEVDVTVTYPQSDRQTLASLEQSRVRTHDGTLVPLSSIADITLDYERTSITRLNKQSAVIISANVDKSLTSPSDVVANLKANVLPDLQRTYHGITLEFAGQAEQQSETTSSMGNLFMLALLVIYLLLAIPLKSYVQPMLIMMAIPFGIIGAIWGHWFSGLAIGILSLNGIMALSGVVVNDSLLLVSRYNELKHQLSVTEAILQTCTDRLRAIFLTSITTFAGLLPILSEDSMQAEFLKPAAASMAYGILFATVITLVLIPVLLKIADDVVNFYSQDREQIKTVEIE